MPKFAGTLFSYAFRPFFILNGVFAIVVMLIWMSSLHGSGISEVSALWHGHEIVIGFGGAAIAGFMLTAVASWTGRPPVQGVMLGWLVFTWLIGRLAMAMLGVLPVPMVAVLDLCFPILLCGVAAREVFAARNRRNYPIVGVVGAVVLLNLVYHLGIAEVISDRSVWVALTLTVHLLLTLITIIGGRIIPSFTANWLKARGETEVPQAGGSLDIGAAICTVVVGIAVSFAATGWLVALLAFTAALVHGLRLAHWRGLATTSEPLLCILHVAYLWFPIGYALMGLSALGYLLPPTAAMHALAMGVVGGMILAVTTRVALGHTGRKLQATRLTVAAYAVFMLAVIVRTLSPLVGEAYLLMLDLAAIGWIVAFVLFTWVYAPILIKPRVD